MRCFIEVYGCQMNVHDAEILSGILGSAGHQITKDPEDAEAVFVVTCAVREHAETRAMGRITHLAGMAGCGSKPLVAVCGCVAQEHGERLLEKVDVIDLVVGPDAYHRIPGLMAEGVRTAEVDQCSEEYEDVTPVRTQFPRAFVNVMRGCDNYCTYCIVPYVRGSERSRSSSDIISEVRKLAAGGFREVTLLGQNVNSYSSGGIGFPELLEKVSDAAGGNCWVRFVTSNPRDLTPGLAEVMASRENICNQFHLPAQSGSDSVLKAMNRGYTRKGYIEKVAMLRELMPDIVLSTDIIAGFPGESPGDFQDTVSLLEEVRFDYAFLFRYSERKGTGALKLKPRVPVKERLSRLSVLQDLHREITIERSKELLGREMTVLVTGPARVSGQTAARTMGNRMVILEGTGYEPGEVFSVRITGADGYTHFGMPVIPPVR